MVLHVMSSFPEALDLQWKCVSLLAAFVLADQQFTQVPPLVLEIIHGGGVTVTSALLRRCGANRQYTIFCLQILAVFCAAEISLPRLSECDGEDACLRCFHLWPADSEVALCVINVFTRAAHTNKSSSYTKRLLALGTIEQIVSAAAPTDRSLQMSCWSALFLLVNPLLEPSAPARAVCAGALRLWRTLPPILQTQIGVGKVVAAKLAAAEKAHDEQPQGCPGCEGCERLRAQHRLCARVGCPSTRRTADGEPPPPCAAPSASTNKKLLRCQGCMTRAYCMCLPSGMSFPASCLATYAPSRLRELPKTRLESSFKECAAMKEARKAKEAAT
jgi:hypothetical protein